MHNSWSYVRHKNLEVAGYLHGSHGLSACSSFNRILVADDGEVDNDVWNGGDDDVADEVDDDDEGEFDNDVADGDDDDDVEVDRVGLWGGS